MSLARQADYDHLVKEMISEGASVEEATAEAQDTFRGSGFDLSSLYLYETAQELKDKEAVELKFRTLEDKSALANYVNSYMAIKALEKILRSGSTSDKLVVGTLKLAESRKLTQSLLKIIEQAVIAADDEDEEEDEDDDDAEENKIATKETLLDFSALVLRSAKSSFLNYDASYVLSQEHMNMLCKLCDQDSGEPRIVDKLLDLLYLLCAHEENRGGLSNAGLAGQLELAAKMNKKNVSIATKVQQLLTLL